MLELISRTGAGKVCPVNTLSNKGLELHVLHGGRVEPLATSLPQRFQKYALMGNFVNVDETDN